MKEVIIQSSSTQLCIIYVPSQQLQGQLQKQQNVNTISYITDKERHEDNSHRAFQ
jgi:hypothetical protein